MRLTNVQVLVVLLEHIKHRLILPLQEVEHPGNALSAIWNVAGAV